MSDLEERTARFAAALSTLHEELDWDLLGELYCHEGGEHFFPEQQRERVFDRIDTSGDGVIDADELEAFLARRGGR